MKIKLNLLPKEKEKKIKNKKILKFIIIQQIMIMIMTLLFFGLILGIGQVSKVRLAEAENGFGISDKSNDFERMKKYEESILRAKDRADLISKIQKSDINWVSVLNKFPEMLPAGVFLSSISNEGYTLLIGGNASNRDALVKTKQNFESDACFKNVDIPLNDIVLKNNIDFELKLEVDKNCLK